MSRLCVNSKYVERLNGCSFDLARHIFHLKFLLVYIVH